MAIVRANMRLHRLGCLMLVVLLPNFSVPTLSLPEVCAPRTDGLSRFGPGTDSVIVTLFEWSWKDVSLECKRFLGPKGYKAVQVSVAQEDVLGNNWWTRYQTVSYKLSSRSGSEAEFIAMVKACRAAGVDVIVDVVLNHMANPQGPGEGRGGSRIKSRCSYPGTYDCQDFHHFCSPCCSCEGCGNCGVGSACDPDNIRHCNLGQSDTDPGLPDLDTSSYRVRATIARFLNRLASIGVAGVRVDAAKHIDPVDLAAILSHTNPALYLNHEVVLEGGESCITASQYYEFGRVWEFKTANVFGAAIKGQDLRAIANMDSNSKWPGGSGIWARGDLAISFVTNHDRLFNAFDRFVKTVTVFDQAGYYIANMILLAHPYGQPNVHSSLNFVPTGDNYGGAPVDTTTCSSPLNCTLIPVFDYVTPNTTSPVSCAYGDTSSTKPYHCEHRVPSIANMVAWRRVAGLSGVTADGIQYYNDGKQMSITRGSSCCGLAFLIVNIGDRFDRNVSTKGMPAGTYCNVLADSLGTPSVCSPCTQACPWTAMVYPDGNTHVMLDRFAALAFHINGKVPA